MTEFTGKLQGIIFSNDQEMFKIISVAIIGSLPGFHGDEIVVTGNFGDLVEGDTYHFSGNLVTHKKFGLQFKADKYKQVMPHEEGSLLKYLSSDKFPGIGRKAAQKILDTLGLDALEIIKENPNKISTLDLSKKQKDVLLQGINKMDNFSDVLLKLAKFGVRKNVATRLYHEYPDQALTQLENDPYEIIYKVSGYAFKTADNIGQSLQIAANDPRRIKGAIYQVLLDKLQGDGNTYVPAKELLLTSQELLGINDYDPISDVLQGLAESGKIVIEDMNVALKQFYETENDIAAIMKKLVDRPVSQDRYSDSELDQAIQDAEKSLKISYDETQKQAIKNALNQPISILTGGPGTGKTTIINGILLCLRTLADIPLSSLQSDDPPFILAAPTGRAAKHMSDITGINAKTIHRLLGLGIGSDSSDDEELNELNGEILIIDEMSMVDMFLFKKLIASIRETTHILFVGDKDQLPSVGAGNVFADLIKSGAFPTTILEQIHRQGDDSTIISLAHAVNSGKDSEIMFKHTKNYSFISCQPNIVDQAVAQITQKALKAGFNPDDIQVLGAMYNGSGGITNLNNVLQEIINPRPENSKVVEAHNEKFHIGDRILQLQNNPEKDIYNGQIGKITGIDLEDGKRAVVANFEGREVNFSLNDLSDVTRAYAITIHKSQGSEFPLVILNLTMQNYVMLKRNLLYTAITRAEKNLVMVGDPKAFIQALKTPGNDRKTGLSKKLQQALGLPTTERETAEESPKPPKAESQTEKPAADAKPQETILTKELIYSGQIDPMIGMEGITLKANKQ